MKGCPARIGFSGSDAEQIFVAAVKNQCRVMGLCFKNEWNRLLPQEIMHPGCWGRRDKRWLGDLDYFSFADVVALRKKAALGRIEAWGPK